MIEIIVIGVGVILYFILDSKEKSVSNYSNTQISKNVIRTEKSNFRSSFPNFYEFIEREKPITKAFLNVENSYKIEYKMPINFFGNIVGYCHIGIEKSLNNHAMYIDAFSKSGFSIQGKRINMFSDISYENYKDNTKSLFVYLMSNEYYLPLSMGQM